MIQATAPHDTARASQDCRMQECNGKRLISYQRNECGRVKTLPVLLQTRQPTIPAVRICVVMSCNGFRQSIARTFTPLFASKCRPSDGDRNDLFKMRHPEAGASRGHNSSSKPSRQRQHSKMEVSGGRAHIWDS